MMADQILLTFLINYVEVIPVSYEKHNFEYGQILYASQLNTMDDQIKQNESSYIELNRALSNKIDIPVEAPTAGKIIKVKSVNDDGSFTCEWANYVSENYVTDAINSALSAIGIAEEGTY